MQKLNSIKPRITTLDLRRGGPVTNRIVGRELTRIRERIMVRDGGACVKCGKGVGVMEIDHVVPLHLGGAESDMNRQLLCQSCHEIKSQEEEKARGN